MATQLHRIFRSMVEMHGFPAETALVWRRRARSLWDEQLAPALEAECNACCRDDVVLRFDQLEVEFTIAENAEPVTIRRAFEKALRERLRTGSRTRRDSSPIPETGLFISSLVNTRKWLEHWLATGLVPWWAGKPSCAALALALLQQLRQADGPAWLRRAIGTEGVAVRRLAWQFDARFHREAMAAIWPAGWPSATGILLEATEQALTRQRAPTESQAGTTVWRSWWQRWLGDIPPPPALVEAATQVLVLESPGESVVARFFDLLLTGTLANGHPVETAADVLRAQSPVVRQTPPLGTDRGEEPPAEDRLVRSRSAISSLEPSALADEPGPLSEVTAPGLPVANAGLVLIAPFLPPFFAALDIHRSPSPAERQNAESAPLLLHYFATAETRTVEHQLALPKLLCGLPLDEPVPCDWDFALESLAEVDRLLASVIEHWTALKNTSIAGLREAFLQRPGLLRDTGREWTLRVEHRAWDILLERVPWTFQTIRLAWMLQPLRVEWRAYA
jgi:hypothetical protein